MIQRLEGSTTVFVEIEENDPLPRPDQRALDLVGFVNYCFKVAQWVIDALTLPYLPQEIQVTVDEKTRWWPAYQGPDGPSRIRTIKIKQQQGRDNRVLKNVIALVKNNEVVFSEGMLDIETGARFHVDPNSDIKAIVFLP